MTFTDWWPAIEVYMHIHATLAEVIHHTDRQKPELATFSVLSRCLCCHLTSFPHPSLSPFHQTPPVNLQVTLRQAPPARLLILCAPVGARQKPVQPLPPVAFFSATGWTDVFRSTFSSRLGPTKASSQLSRPARKPSQCNKSQVYQKNGKFLRLETKGLEKTYCSQVMGDWNWNE